MRITGGQVFDLHEGFLRRDVCFDGRLLSDSSSDGKIYDAAGCYVIPGLTDLHFPGGDKVVLGCYRLAKKLFKFN